MFALVMAGDYEQGKDAVAGIIRVSFKAMLAEKRAPAETQRCDAGQQLPA
jgi:hypothetical protein